MRVEQIFEARSNSNLNPRMTANDILALYGNQRDVYVHFSQSDKIGVNPNPNPAYPNPYGVYSYSIENVKKETNGFSYPVFDRLFAGDMKYIFVFRYNSVKPLNLRATNIPDREFDAVRQFFISKSNGTQLNEINDTFRGSINSAADLWKIVFRLIELLRLPSSKTSYIVFRKVLGYDMIVDDGMGIMYGGKGSSLRHQVVHLETSKIKVVEKIDNKRSEPKDRMDGRREYSDYQKSKDNDDKKENEKLMAKMSVDSASVPVTNGSYPNYMIEFSNIVRKISSGGDAVALSQRFYGGLIELANTISKREEIPSDEEIGQIVEVSLVSHYLTGISTVIDILDGDMIFDIQRDLVDEYKQTARAALSELRNLK